MTIHQPMPPIPPRPPALPSENAGNSERADYLAKRTKYQAEMTIYETAVAKYQRDLRAYMVDQDAGQPQPLQAEPVPDVEPAEQTEPPPATLPAPDPPQITFDFGGSTFVKPHDLSEFNLALNLAASAVAMQVDAGDYHWHGGDDEFSWPDQAGNGVKMDAETFIEFSKAAFNAN